MSEEGLPDANRRMLNYLRDRVEDLETENESLRERLANLESIVDPDPSADYSELPKSRKVYKLRKALVEEAAQATGTAKMDYKEVRWLFDGQPSVGHTYDLMELAGQLDGFSYDTEPQHRITVKLDGVNDETLVHAANKARQGEAA